MATTQTRKSYQDALDEIVDQYLLAHGNRPIEIWRVAEWAIAQGLWEPRRHNPTRELAKQLARALRTRRVTDPQGRSVRAMHAVRYERVDQNGNRISEAVWDYIFQMSREHAERSFDQRWQHIADKSESLQKDIASFNDNNPNAGDRPIQKTFDFTDALRDSHEQEVDEIPYEPPRRPR
jgi:hypothetical protein